MGLLFGISRYCKEALGCQVHRGAAGLRASGTCRLADPRLSGSGVGHLSGP